MHEFLWGKSMPSRPYTQIRLSKLHGSGVSHRQATLAHGQDTTLAGK